MYKYVLVFRKSGEIKYTSHLDMLRLFKRAFRRTGIELAYSQGYNPHPKMRFAQPLSLGYEASGELLEFETKEPVSRKRLMEDMAKALPAGVEITSCGRIGDGQKSLAASITQAQYEIRVPLSWHLMDYPEVTRAYLQQDQILAMKKQKKTKKLVEVDIKEKIRQLTAEPTEEDTLLLKVTTDCGSKSNLSPEQVIASYLEFIQFDIPRYRIEVDRKSLEYPIDFTIKWM